MMAIGFIELVVIVLILGVVGSIVSAVRQEESFGWVKILVTIFGVQLLIGAGVFGFYVQARQVSQMAKVREQEVIAAAEAAQAMAVQQRLKYESGHTVAEDSGDETAYPEDGHAESPTSEQPHDHAHPPEPHSSISEEGYTEGHDGVASHGHGGHHGGHFEEPQFAVGSAPIIMGVVGFVLVLAFLLTIARKNAMLAVALIGGLVLVGAGTMFVSTEVDHGVPMPTVIKQESSSIESIGFDSSAIEPGSIPVTAAEIAAVEESDQWTSITEVSYGEGPRIDFSTEVNELPNWVKNSNGKPLIVPARDEIILHSKRYATIEEAESELWPIAVSFVSEYLTRAYPEMKNYAHDPMIIKNSGVLDQAIQVAYPLPGFDEQVYQVHWKLTADENIKEHVYAHWKKDEVTQRLFLLGGGIGVVTLLCGVGAVASRHRERKTAA